MIADQRQRPDPRLAFDPRALGLSEPGRAFFRRDTVRVARGLVGAWIARRWRGRWYGGRIVETEAYLGPADRAAHSWNGRRTPRVEPMYADGGHLYVFLVYGMHHCANVVTRREGVAEAVLLRAAEAPGDAPARLLAGPRQALRGPRYQRAGQRARPRRRTGRCASSCRGAARASGSASRPESESTTPATRRHGPCASSTLSSAAVRSRGDVSDEGEEVRAAEASAPAGQASVRVGIRASRGRLRADPAAASDVQCGKQG